MYLITTPNVPPPGLQELSKQDMDSLALWKDYEHQYGVLTAEITAKVGQLSLTSGDDKRKIIIDVDKHMEEAQELLEQMDLEVREIKADVRPKFRTRLDSYRAELGRLSHEFVKNKQQLAETFQQESYYSEPFSFREEQKQRLLDNSERIERTGSQLKTGFRALLETEEIGAGVLRDLHDQRETIEKSRNRLRETEADLNRGTRIVNSMISRSMQHKFILYVIAGVFAIVIVVSIYLSFT